MISVLLAAAACTFAGDDIAFLGYPNGVGPRAMIVDAASGSVRTVGPDADAGPPAWSADGSRLAFVSHGDRDRIYVTGDSLDEGRFLLHGESASLSAPAWSPDGSRLAYAVGDGLDSQIAVYRLETDEETLWGGGRTSLTVPAWITAELADHLMGTASDLTILVPRLLPGKEPEPMLLAVGFTGGPGALSTDLLVVTPETVSPIVPDRMPSHGIYAEWSPSTASDALAFDSDDGGDREIFIVSRRGAFDLSNHRSADTNPVWSPDEKWIAFESARSGKVGIYRTHRDTGRIETVAVLANGASWDPTWSPDGEFLAFVSDRTGIPRLYVAEIRTREFRMVSPENLAVSAPAWRPER